MWTERLAVILDQRQLSRVKDVGQRSNSTKGFSNGRNLHNTTTPIIVRRATKLLDTLILPEVGWRLVPRTRQNRAQVDVCCVGHVANLRRDLRECNGRN